MIQRSMFLMFPQLRSISKIFKLTDTLRILGITFDRKLKFKDHIAEQTKKACTKIYPPGRNDTTLQNLCQLVKLSNFIDQFVK